MLQILPDPARGEFVEELHLISSKYAQPFRTLGENQPEVLQNEILVHLYNDVDRQL